LVDQIELIDVLVVHLERLPLVIQW
jgi:hypothetical protein